MPRSEITLDTFPRRLARTARPRAFIRFTKVPGDDPPLLWLHGLMCSSTGELMQAAVQPKLRGRRQLLIDFLGYGYSDRPVGFGYTLEDHTRTIVALIDALALTECGVIGHSMGGGVGILVAAARPTIVSLLIMAEGRLGLHPDGPDPIADQAEQDFVDRGPVLTPRRRRRAWRDQRSIRWSGAAPEPAEDPRALV